MGSLYAFILPIMALVGLIVTASYYLHLDPIIAKVALGVGALAIFLVTIIGLVRRLRVPKSGSKADPEKDARRQLRATRKAEARALRRRLKRVRAALGTERRERRTRAAGALPCWVVLGPAGHGKSTLLAAAPGAREIAGEDADLPQPRFFLSEAGVFIELPGDYERRPSATLASARLMRWIRAAQPRQPVVGILVVHRVDALTPEETTTARELVELRRQIDHLARELEVQAPVTLIVTQIDRLAGFADLCADRQHVDTARALGVTLAPRATADTIRASASDRFAADDGPLAWVESLCHVTVVRSQAAPWRQARLYGLWQRLAELSCDAGAIAGQLAASPLPGGDPLPVRAIYFTSAAGQRHPEPDAFFERLARSVGGALPAADDAAPSPPAQAFVAALFTTELPRDSIYGARLSGRRRRAQVLRMTAAAAMLAVGGLVSASASRSVEANRRLLEETGNLSLEVLRRPADAEQESLQSPDELSALRVLVELWQADEPPEGHGWGLFRGDLVAEAVRSTYRGAVCRGVLRPIAMRTEDELRRFAQDYSGGGVPTSMEWRDGFERLRMYLLLSIAEPSIAGEPAPWGEDQRKWLIAQLVRGPTTPAGAEPDERARILNLEMHASLMLTVGGDPSAQDACLRSGGARTIARDGDVVRRVREILRRDHSESATVDRLVDTINSQRSFRPIDLISLTPSIHIISHEAFVVRGAFTRAGWDEFSNLVAAEVQGELNEDPWVLGRERHEGSRDDRCQVLVGIYVDRYEQAWRHFLDDLFLHSPGTISEAAAIYKDLSDNKPLVSVFAALDKHTQRLPSITCAPPLPTTSLLQRIAANSTKTPPAAPPVREIGKNAKYLGGVFERLLGLAVSPTEGEGAKGAGDPNLGINNYHEQLIRLRQAADQALENEARVEALIESLSSALVAVDSTIKRTDLGPWEDRAERLLMPPLRGLDVVLKKGAATSLNEEWCRRVIDPMRRTIAANYPFDREGRKHASLEDIRFLFHPEDGDIARFRDEKLSGFVARNGDAIEEKSLGLEARLHVNPAIVELLNRSHQLGILLFSTGEASIDFAADMTCDSRINKVELWIDEVHLRYECSIHRRKEIHWPGKGSSHLARVIAHSTTSKEDMYSKPNEFGLLELFEKDGAPKVDISGGVVLTFNMHAYGKITVRLYPRRPHGGTIFSGFGNDTAHFLAPFRAAGFTQPPTSLFVDHPYSCPSLETP